MHDALCWLRVPGVQPDDCPFAYIDIAPTAFFAAANCYAIAFQQAGGPSAARRWPKWWPETLWPQHLSCARDLVGEWGYVRNLSGWTISIRTLAILLRPVRQAAPYSALAAGDNL